VTGTTSVDFAICEMSPVNPAANRKCVAGRRSTKAPPDVFYQCRESHEIWGLFSPSKRSAVGTVSVAANTPQPVETTAASSASERRTVTSC
jgi:hypothetical protein